jgi:hypothetical protein
LNLYLYMLPCLQHFVVGNKNFFCPLLKRLCFFSNLFRSVGDKREAWNYCWSLKALRLECFSSIQNIRSFSYSRHHHTCKIPHSDILCFLCTRLKSFVYLISNCLGVRRWVFSGVRYLPSWRVSSIIGIIWKNSLFVETITPLSKRFHEVKYWCCGDFSTIVVVWRWGIGYRGAIFIT